MRLSWWAMRITALLFVGALATGCTAPTVDWVDHPYSLDYAQRHYTQLVRWGELERSGLYVDPVLREAYLASAPELDGIRFTDYEVMEFVLDSTEKTATVTVLFTGYSLATLLESSGRMSQVWYREGDEEDSGWKVRSDLTSLREAFASVMP